MVDDKVLQKSKKVPTFGKFSIKQSGFVERTFGIDCDGEVQTQGKKCVIFIKRKYRTDMMLQKVRRCFNIGDDIELTIVEI